MVPVRWLEVGQSDGSARGRKSSKIWEKSLKNYWVNGRSDVAKPDLGTWHDQNNNLGYIQCIYGWKARIHADKSKNSLEA